MTFTIWTMTKDGWSIVSESEDINDSKFGSDDTWAFNHILTEGIEYIQMGETMWSIENE
jgi:hypothetical protein